MVIRRQWERLSFSLTGSQLEEPYGAGGRKDACDGAGGVWDGHKHNRIWLGNGTTQKAGLQHLPRIWRWVCDWISYHLDCFRTLISLYKMILESLRMHHWRCHNRGNFNWHWLENRDEQRRFDPCETLPFAFDSQMLSVCLYTRSDTPYEYSLMR